MPCHISALCIALPCTKRGLVETTLGRGIHGGWRRHPSRPLQSTNLSLSLHRGGHLLRRAPSTSLPSFSRRRRRSSALMPPRVYVGETHKRACAQTTCFQAGAATQSQRRPRRIGSQTRRRCFVASPVSSTVGAQSLRARSHQKGCTPPSH